MKRALLVLALCPLLIGCGSRIQAGRTIGAMESAAVRNNYNLKQIISRQSTQMLDENLAKADALADAAVQAEVGADGKANPINLKIIMEDKAEHYKKAFAVSRKTNELVRKSDKDLEHLLQYSKGLQEYFKLEQSRANVIDQSMNAAGVLIDRFVGKKKEDK